MRSSVIESPPGSSIEGHPDESPADAALAPSLFHRPEWEQVFAVYGLRWRRLTVQRDGKLVGVLPLVWQKSWLFGNQLVSLPWFDAAGVQAADDAARKELTTAALDLSAEWGATTVQLRQSEDVALSPHVRTDKVVQKLKLESDPEALWKRLKATVRNQVRKSEKSGLVVSDGGIELLDDFFRVYSHNMRDLGSPSHAKALFSAVLEAFPQESRLYVVRHGSVAIGGGLTLANGETLEIPWASSLKEYNSFCVNHALYWRILEDACRAGYRWFSFGRSTRDSGPHRYKKQWRPDEFPLHWCFIGANDGVAASAAVPPQEKFGLASRVWSRLPVWLSRHLGPRIMARVP